MNRYRLAVYAIGLFMLPAAAFADGSLSVTPPYPGATVSAGTRISFSVVPSGFTPPVTYRIVDSFPGGANSGNVDSAGAFFYSTNLSDAGTHTLTITASDAAGTTGGVTSTFTVLSSPTATLAAATSTVIVGTQISFTITSQGLFNPTYGASDSFAGSSLRSNIVNADGTFIWTPLWQDIGTHTISVTSKDSFGFSTTTSQKIIIISGLPEPVVAPVATTSTASSNIIKTTVPPVSAPVKTNTYLFTKYLTVGSGGAEVTALQRVLIAGGYLSGSATGYFGQLTKRALMAYQQAHGLQPLGFVGPGTRAALNR